MLLSVSQLMSREDKTLALYAIKNSTSRGRAHNEPSDDFRLPFQKDRDRIIHSKAFRRLQGKTQVFRAYSGDHFRSRLTHSLEVSQIARDIARSLALNEDLTEAIGLAHDLGHTPFGHAGEEALSNCMKPFGDSFEHNRQSRRVVEFLEKKYAGFSGLNLTYEVLDGLIKHRSTYDKGELGETSLEAKVVNMADSIAYNAHDIDDGIRGGIITLASLKKLTIWQDIDAVLAHEKIDDEEMLRQRVISALVRILVHDIVQEASKNFEKNIWEADFSSVILSKVLELQAYLREHFYFNEKVYSQSLKGQKIIEKLFEAFMKNEKLMPKEIRDKLTDEKRHTVVKDYIAGMTDHFAITLAESIE